MPFDPRLGALAALVLLVPMIAAPSCTNRGAGPTPDDSKRAVKMGIISGPIVVKDGEKVIPKATAECLGPEAGPGVFTDPETREQGRCRFIEITDDLPELDVSGPAKFRLLVRGPVARVSLHIPNPQLSAGEDFYGPFPGDAAEIARGRPVNEGRQIWEFRLPELGGARAVQFRVDTDASDVGWYAVGVSDD